MELTAERNTPSIENKVKGGKCLSISCRPEDCLKTIHSLDKSLIEVSLALKNMNTKIEYTEATVNKLSKKVEVMSEANVIKIPDIVKNITLLIIGGIAGAVLNLIIGG